MRAARITIGLTISVIVGAACVALRDCCHQDNFHACTVESYNSRWAEMRVTLHHTDNRSCPAQYAPGDWVTGGGTIEENVNTCCPYGQPKQQRGELEIREFFDASRVTVWRVEYFESADFNGDGLNNEWIAFMSATWLASPDLSGRDRAWFYAFLKAEPNTNPGLAKTVIDYWERKL